ncbi:MAG: Rne/Rng family ribonuclease [Balneolales bacterium]
MKNQIIVHAANKQTRIALIEKGELAQLFIESPENQRTVGDIYLAEVHKVMAGIRAAFIDLGTPRDAFLHFSDTGEYLEDYIVMLNGKKALPKNYDKIKADQEAKDNLDKRTPSISELQNRQGALLQQKQRLLVQIVKEPIGTKGPRVSTNISIAGRFLVLMPMGDYVGVSKRIRSHKERRRLRQVVSDILPEGFGVIIRTVADGQKDEAIHEDLKDVLTKWEALISKIENAKPPELLHRDLDMTESLVRDLFAKDYDRVLIDDHKLYKSIKSYISRVAPAMVPNIHHYKGSEHIFDYMKIGKDVDSVFSPRVKMPSGGYLIFEQTEAMYVVDVNSGRYAAKKNQEDNSLKTNLEAAREVAKQLRLRDIGGIIVVDFIDLWDENNRKKIYDELKREFRKDRAKTNLLAMSDFGLVQITRQRIRPSVVNAVSKVCPNCGGSGTIVTQSTIIADIESWLTKYRYTYKQRNVDLHVNPYLHSMLTGGMISKRTKWMFKRGMFISIIPDETISLNDFTCTLPATDFDITEAVMKDQPIDEAIKESEDTLANLPPEKKTSQDIDLYERDGSKKIPDKGSKAKESKTGQPDKPSRQRPAPSRRSAPKPKPRANDADKDKAEEAKKVEAKKTEQPKKGKVASKYYKTDKQGGDQSNKAAAKSPDPLPEKAQEKAAEKPSTEASAPPADKPRSALEVAREHRLKKEQEEADNARKKDTSATATDESKSEETSANRHLPVSENGQPTEEAPAVKSKDEESAKDVEAAGKGGKDQVEGGIEAEAGDQPSQPPAKGKSPGKPAAKKTAAKSKNTQKAKPTSAKKADKAKEGEDQAGEKKEAAAKPKPKAKPKSAKRPKPAPKKKKDTKAKETSTENVENPTSSKS